MTQMRGKMWTWASWTCQWCTGITVLLSWWLLFSYSLCLWHIWSMWRSSSFRSSIQLFSDESEYQITGSYNWKGKRRKDFHLKKGLRYHRKSRDLPLQLAAESVRAGKLQLAPWRPISSSLRFNWTQQPRLVTRSVTPWFMAERAPHAGCSAASMTSPTNSLSQTTMGMFFTTPRGLNPAA